MRFNYIRNFITLPRPVALHLHDPKLFLPRPLAAFSKTVPNPKLTCQVPHGHAASSLNKEINSFLNLNVPATTLADTEHKVYHMHEETQKGAIVSPTTNY